MYLREILPITSNNQKKRRKEEEKIVCTFKETNIKLNLRGKNCFSSIRTNYEISKYLKKLVQL
jgi:hypothetical protein